MNTYAFPIEQQMQRFYRSLNERDRRRYAAIEALKLGHGGIRYVGVLGCDATTLAKGIQELGSEELETRRQRKAGRPQSAGPAGEQKRGLPAASRARLSAAQGAKKSARWVNTPIAMPSLKRARN